MKKYRKKNSVIEAIQIEDKMILEQPEVRALCAEHGWLGGPDGISIPTWKGEQHARAGDWLTIDAEGNYTLIRGDVFDMIYEEVEEVR